MVISCEPNGYIKTHNSRFQLWTDLLLSGYARFFTNIKRNFFQKIASKTRKIYEPPEVHKSKRELGVLIYPLGSQEITKLPSIKQQI